MTLCAPLLQEAVAALQGRLGDPSAVFLVASPEEGKVAMAAAVSPAAVAGGLQVLNTAYVHPLAAWDIGCWSLCCSASGEPQCWLSVSAEPTCTQAARGQC